MPLYSVISELQIPIATCSYAQTRNILPLISTPHTHITSLLSSCHLVPLKLLTSNTPIISQMDKPGPHDYVLTLLSHQHIQVLGILVLFLHLFRKLPNQKNPTI